MNCKITKLASYGWMLVTHIFFELHETNAQITTHII